MPLPRCRLLSSFFATLSPRRTRLKAAIPLNTPFFSITAHWQRYCHDIIVFRFDARLFAALRRYSSRRCSLSPWYATFSTTICAPLLYTIFNMPVISCLSSDIIFSYESQHYLPHAAAYHIFHVHYRLSRRSSSRFSHYIVSFSHIIYINRDRDIILRYHTSYTLVLEYFHIYFPVYICFITHTTHTHY
jgi:hypothetical protein